MSLLSFKVILSLMSKMSQRRGALQSIRRCASTTLVDRFVVLVVIAPLLLTIALFQASTRKLKEKRNLIEEDF